MVNSYYHLLGHVVAAVFACRESGELLAALNKGGFSKEALTEGERLAHDAEALIQTKVDAVGEDRIREHVVHIAASELEMWLQTAVFKLKKAGADEKVISLVQARELHTHDHALTVAALALRTITMYRCDDRVVTALNGEKTVREMINRGFSLSKRLYTSTDLRLEPEGREVELPVFAALLDAATKMEQWLLTLDAATHAVAQKDVRLLGRLGYAPNDVGIPVGGTSYAVILHERGQAPPPDPRIVTDCPGWSVGRQGRNRENLGKGWVEPRFDN